MQTVITILIMQITLLRVSCYIILKLFSLLSICQYLSLKWKWQTIFFGGKTVYSFGLRLAVFFAVYYLTQGLSYKNIWVKFLQSWTGWMKLIRKLKLFQFVCIEMTMLRDEIFQTFVWIQTFMSAWWIKKGCYFFHIKERLSVDLLHLWPCF